MRSHVGTSTGPSPYAVGLRLASLTTIGSLAIYRNSSLTDLDGLASLTTVVNDLYISINSVLCQSYIDTLIASISIGGSTYTTGNDTGC